MGRRIDKAFGILAAVILVAGVCLPRAESLAQDAAVLPAPAAEPFKGKIGLTYGDSTSSFPPIKLAPQGAPNILLVLLDDVGFSTASTFGGPVATPALDRLATSGLRYNEFHTTALCSPTRAALLTGRNHHAAGMGVITNLATGYPGYDSIIPKSTATIAEILRQNGYNTAAFGKWHLTPSWETSVAGPFDHWPTHMGFDYFYGFLPGMTDQYAPDLVEGTTPIEPYLHRKNYLLTPDLADKAIAWIRYQHSVAPQKPFFVYFATGATHAPHQVGKEWIDKYKGKFDQGWDKLREENFVREKQLGVIPASAKLTPRPKQLPAWDSLTAEQKHLAARLMEVYAGFMAQTDYEVGRVIDAIAGIGAANNTLIFYIVGDNGASPEGRLMGTTNEWSFFNGMPYNFADDYKLIDQLGGPNTYENYPVGFAWACDAPFQWTKQVASHLGGTRNPLIVSWPGRITGKGGLRSQFHHVIDIAPTILEAAGLREPAMVNGVAQRPMEGVSMVYTFDHPQAPSRHTRQYFEMFGNRAMYDGGWMASCLDGVPWETEPLYKDIRDCKWELYDLTADYSQADDLAAKYPDRLRELKDLFWAEAARNNVLPLDDRKIARIKDILAQPRYGAGRTQFTLYPGTTRLSELNGPSVRNRSYSITAVVDVPASGAQGMIVTDGGRFGGYGLFIQDGHLVYVYNFLNVARYTISSTEKMPAGRSTVRFEFAYDGEMPGRGGTGTLFINDKQFGGGRIEHTEPVVFESEGLDVGLDTGTPVAETYQVPFTFTGTIDKVEFQLGKEIDLAQLAEFAAAHPGLAKFAAEHPGLARFGAKLRALLWGASK